jgi:hypothetical protein
MLFSFEVGSLLTKTPTEESSCEAEGKDVWQIREDEG